MPSNHLILCHPLLLLPSIFPSIRVFSNESAFCIRWPKYWSFSSSISPSNEYLQRKHMPNHRVVGFKYLKFFFKIYLFNFDCAGSRCIAFLQVAPGASPHCGAQVFTAPAVKGDVSLVSCWRAQALGVRTSVLQLPGSRALAWSFWQGLGSSTACGIFPDQGSATFIDRQLLTTDHQGSPISYNFHHQPHRSKPGGKKRSTFLTASASPLLSLLRKDNQLSIYFCTSFTKSKTNFKMRQARQSVQGILIHISFVQNLFCITTLISICKFKSLEGNTGKCRPSLGFSIFVVAWKPSALVKQILDYIPTCYLDYLDYIDYIQLWSHQSHN